MEEPQPGQTIAVGGNHGRGHSRACSVAGRGKSELHRAVRRVTPGQGNLTDQWHRKYTARLRASRFVGQASGLARRSSLIERWRAEEGKGEKVR